MDCREVIHARRSIRQYKPTPVQEEALQQILEAGLMAPSAVNYQPWYFAAIKSTQAMERLSEIMSQASKAIQPTLTKRFPSHPDMVDEVCHFIDTLGGAPVCILAFQLKSDYENTHSTIVQSISAAIENMLLAAWSMGIGSCWLTAPLEAGVGQLIQDSFAPGKGELAALITLGYPAKIPNAPLRKKGRYTIL